MTKLISQRLLVLGAMVGVMALSAIAQPASDQAATIAEMQKQIQALQEQLERIKEGPPRDEKAESLLKQDFFKMKGLSLGFYGEAKYRFPESGANVFDPHRFVLLPSYQITDWLVFNSEIELEHGAVDESTNNGRNRFNGELELEQFYVDILIHEHFNIRSLGIDVVPVGRINKYHEPTVFYSTERPELYREIIPTTWFEPSLGAFGKIIEGLDYQLMISTGLEDVIPGVTNSSGASIPGVSATDGMRNARPRLRAANENGLAYTARLHYSGIKNLDASASAYTARVRGINNTRSSLTLFDIEAKYLVPKTGLELRGELAWWDVGSPENLAANNNSSLSDNVGRSMYGWYVEAAYHWFPSAWKNGRLSNADFVPFIRYSDIVTQNDLLSGSALADGTGNKDFLTIGASLSLNENFVFKADWRRNLNGSATTKTQSANQDYFQLGAGMFF